MTLANLVGQLRNLSGRSRQAVLVRAGVATAVIAVVVVLVLAGGHDHSSRPTAAVSTATPAASVSAQPSAPVTEPSAAASRSVTQATQAATQASQTSAPAAAPPSTQTPAPVPSAPPPLNQLVGVYEGPDWAGSVAGFADLLGRKPTVVLSYEDSSTWQLIAQPDYVLQRYYGTPYRVVLSVPMLPNDPTTTLRAGAAGAYDAYFAQLGRNLMAHGAVHAILRIGWEMNGNYYRWGWGADVRGGNPDYSYRNTAEQNASDFRAYFRRIVSVLRSTPGQAFVIDWSPTLGSGPAGAPVEAGYPGDDVVDLIGEDVYDAIWHTKISAVDRWERMVTEGGGLAWQAQFAEEHGKKVSFPEWGMANTAWQNGGGGGDDPYFVDHLVTWMAGHPTAYQAYFDSDNPAGQEQHRLADFPNGRARYLAAFSGAAVAAAAAASPSAPTPSAASPAASATAPPTASATPAAPSVGPSSL